MSFATIASVTDPFGNDNPPVIVKLVDVIEVPLATAKDNGPLMVVVAIIVSVAMVNAPLAN